MFRYLTLRTPDDAARASHCEETQTRLSERPSVVVVKADWCGACKRFEPPLSDAVKALARSDASMNVVLIDQDTFRGRLDRVRRRRAESLGALDDALRRLSDNGAGRYVPYIAMLTPRPRPLPTGDRFEVAEYEGAHRARDLLEFVRARLLLLPSSAAARAGDEDDLPNAATR